MLAAAAALRPPPAWRGGRQEPLALVVGVPLVVFAVLAAVWSAGLAPGSGAGVQHHRLLAGGCRGAGGDQPTGRVRARRDPGRRRPPRGPTIRATGEVRLRRPQLFRRPPRARGRDANEAPADARHDAARLGAPRQRRLRARPATTIPTARSASCSGPGTSAPPTSPSSVSAPAGSLLRAGGQPLDLSRDRPARGAHRPHPVALHVPRAGCRARRGDDRRRSPQPRRPAGGRPRHRGGRRLQLGRHPGAPADARVRGAGAGPGQAGRPRGLPHLEPLPRSGPGAGRRRREPRGAGGRAALHGDRRRRAVVSLGGRRHARRPCCPWRRMGAGARSIAAPEPWTDDFSNILDVVAWAAAPCRRRRRRPRTTKRPPAGTRGTAALSLASR